jgi:hypothetical protein
MPLSTDTPDSVHYRLSPDPEAADYLNVDESPNPDLKHTNQFSGSGSLGLLYDFLSLKNLVNVPSKKNRITE